MAMFASFTRRTSVVDGQTEGRVLPAAIRQALPRSFEAVAEALASDADTIGACSVVGRDVARDGAALGEALDGLRATFALVNGTPPDFASVEALSVAWSEATLEFLHQLSCEDPLTGLATLAHVRTRLDELYRDAGQNGVPVLSSHALIVVELRPSGVPATAEDPFARALRLVRVTEMVRAVFSGGETIGRLNRDRAVAVVPRRRELGTSVDLLRELLSGLGLGSAEARVWIEGLPALAHPATRLLDELARPT